MVAEETGKLPKKIKNSASNEMNFFMLKPPFISILFSFERIY